MTHEIVGFEPAEKSKTPKWLRLENSPKCDLKKPSFRANDTRLDTRNDTLRKPSPPPVSLLLAAFSPALKGIMSVLRSACFSTKLAYCLNPHLITLQNAAL
jgi:hypothetical protein